MCTVALALTVGTAALSGAMQASQASAQSKQYKRQAQQARIEGQMRADELSRRNSIAAGKQNALYGASGVDPGSGSPTEVLADTAAAGARDVFNTQYLADQRAQSYEASAANASAAGRSALFGSILGGSINAFKTGGWESLFAPSNTGPTGSTFATELSQGVRPI
jgi:hypothetical protein